MLHLMRQALADTAAAGQDDRPAAGGDVDMVDQGAAAPDPEVPTDVSLRRHSRAHLRPCRSRLTHTARGAPGSRTARGPAHGVPRIGLARVQTAFSTSRTSEVPADLRMGES